MGLRHQSAMASVVDVMGYRMNWERPWLWNISLIRITEVRRPAHYGWHHSLGWDPGLYEMG